MREPSSIVKRSPMLTVLLEMKEKLGEVKKRIQLATIERDSLERDIYLLEKTYVSQAGIDLHD